MCVCVCASHLCALLARRGWGGPAENTWLNFSRTDSKQFSAALKNPLMNSRHSHSGKAVLGTKRQ